MMPLRTVGNKLVHVLIFIGIFFIINTCKKNPVEPDVCPDPLIRKAVDFGACWCPCGDSLVFFHCLWPNVDSCGIYVMDTARIFRRFVLKDLYVQDPRWSPKGDWIVFFRSGQIYKIKTNGDSLALLTFSGENFFPNWSPDGKKIIYDRTDSVSGIWMMDSDGGNKRWVVGGRKPSFSPDGSKILFVSLGEQLVLADTTGSNVVKLTSLTGIGTHYPSFSPQGDKIVFSQQLNLETINVWVMNSDGSDVKQLTFQGGDWPCWTSDGS